MPILKPVWQQSLACQKALLDISDNLVSDIADVGFLGDNNYANGNIHKDTEAKSNPDENITGKNNDDLCKKDHVTKIEELFQ